MNKTRKLVIAAALVALIVVLAFTPLGYLRIGPFSITFLTIPVAIGAILLGEWYGLALGTVFGLTSFMQCFGLEAFGTLLFSMKPFAMFVTTVITRALTGYLTALIYKLISKKDKKKLVSIIIATGAAGVLNTLLFTGTLTLFFFKENLDGFADFSQMSLWQIVAFIVWLNPLVEIPVCAVIGTAVSKVLVAVLPRANKGRRL